MQASVIDAQEAFYGKSKGPPILPHTDDRDAALLRKELQRLFQKRQQERKEKENAKKSKQTPEEQQTAMTIDPELKELFPASQLPKGFPPELAYRALAAFSTIRTLSITLRLSPFTPNVFLRALYLPYPTRLLGHIHVAILRILLPALHMGYHWPISSNNSSSSTKSNKVPVPPLTVVKKRKHDNVRWPLRAGDNLEYLDHFTWPVFFDDYAHLTADSFYASWNSEENFVDMKNLDVSMIPSDLVPGEHPSVKMSRIGTADYYRSSRSQQQRQQQRGPPIIYLDGSDDEEEDEAKAPSDDEDEFKDDGAIPSDDEMDEDFGSAKKRKRGRPRKSQPKKTKMSSLPSHQQQRAQQNPTYVNPQQRQQLFLMQQRQLYQQQQQHLARGNVQQALLLQNLQRQQQMQFQMQMQMQHAPNNTAAFTASQMAFAAAQQSRNKPIPQIRTMVAPSTAKAQTHQQSRNPTLNPPPHSTRPSKPPTKLSTPIKSSPTVIISNGRKIEKNSPFLPYKGGLDDLSKDNPPLPKASTSSKIPALRANPQGSTTSIPLKAESSNTVKQVQMERTASKGNSIMRTPQPVAQRQLSLVAKHTPATDKEARPVAATGQVQSVNPQKEPSVTQPERGLTAEQGKTALSSNLLAPNQSTNVKQKSICNATKEADKAISVPTSMLEEVPDRSPKANSLIPPATSKSNAGNSTTTIEMPMDTEAQSIEGSPSTNDGTTGSKPDEAAKVDLLTSLSTLLRQNEGPTKDDSSNERKEVIQQSAADVTMTDTADVHEKQKDQTDIVASKERDLSRDENAISAHGKSSKLSTEYTTSDQQASTKANQESAQVQSNRPGAMLPAPSTGETSTVNGGATIQHQTPVAQTREPPTAIRDPTLSVSQPQRVLNLVLSLATQQQRLSSDLAEEPKRAYRNEIALLSGIKSNTFPVVLSQLKKKGLIEYDPELIHLTHEGAKQARIVDILTYSSKSFDAQLVSRLSSQDQTGGVRNDEPAKVSVTAQTLQSTDNSRIDSQSFSQAKAMAPAIPPTSENGVGKPQVQACDQSKDMATSIVEKEAVSKLVSKERASSSPKHTTTQIAKAAENASIVPTQVETSQTAKSAEKGAIIAKQSESAARKGPTSTSNSLIEDANHAKQPSQVTPGNGPQTTKDNTKNDVEVNGTKETDESSKSAKKSREALVHDVSERSRDWPHFSSLQAMRSGTPYHRLSVQEKLDLLEFLIDDLISLDYIAAEMNRRHEQNGHLGRTYGQLPKSTDMDNLENEDYCAICQNEGELLCCDGCPSSIHRECIGMSKYAELPEGQWYCPECQQVDGAKYGTLDGGRKARLEWYTPRADYPNDEYLVIGGFAFRRPKDTSTMDVKAMMGKSMPPPTPMNPVDLRDDYKKFGPFTTAEWPIVQLPVTRHILWGGAKRESTYFKEPHSYDPNGYKSSYQRAPLDGTLRRVKDPQFSNFEHRCYQLSANTLSSKIIPSMDCDDYLHRGFYNDASSDLMLQMIRGYMAQLEKNLIKAYLLEESWGLRLKKSPKSGKFQEDWTTMVTKSTSVNRLSRLLIQIVDASHPLVFSEGWFHCTNVKPSAEETGNCKPETSMKIAPMVKPELLLCQKRNWERASAGNVQLLLSCKGKRLTDWISEMRPDQGVQQRGNKRKKGGPVAPSTGAENVANHSDVRGDSAAPLNVVEDANKPPQSLSGIQAATSSTSTEAEKRANIQTESEAKAGRVNEVHGPTKDDETMSLADSIETETGSSVQTQSKRKSKGRRRSSRVSTENLIESVKAADEQDLKSDILDSMKSVLKNIPEPLIEGRAPDHFWPVAGRVPFDPIGRLPLPEIRRLARNGGSVHAHSVHYSMQFEVGQVSYGHVWRKRALFCDNVEELMHLIRVLQSFIDNGIVSRAASCARMINKSGFDAFAQIEASQRDVSDGQYFYLVKDKMSNWTWKSFRDVALNQLVHRKMCRREKLLEKHREIHRIAIEKKIAEDAVRLQAQRQKDQERFKALATEHAAKRKALEEEKAAKKKAKQDEIMRKRAAKAAEKAKKDEEKARKAAERARKAEEDKRLAEQQAQLRAQRIAELRRKEAQQVAQIRAQANQSQPNQSITLPSVAGLPQATYDSRTFLDPNFNFKTKAPQASPPNGARSDQKSHQSNLSQHIHSILRDHQVGFLKLSTSDSVRQEDLTRLRRTSLRRLGQMYSIMNPGVAKEQLQQMCLQALQKMEQMISSQNSNKSEQTSSAQSGSQSSQTQPYGGSTQTATASKRARYNPSSSNASQYAPQPQIHANPVHQKDNIPSQLPAQSNFLPDSFAHSHAGGAHDSTNSHIVATTSPMNRAHDTNRLPQTIAMAPSPHATTVAQINQLQSQTSNQQHQYQYQQTHGHQQHEHQYFGQNSGSAQSTVQNQYQQLYSQAHQQPQQQYGHNSGTAPSSVQNQYQQHYTQGSQQREQQYVQNSGTAYSTSQNNSGAQFQNAAQFAAPAAAQWNSAPTPGVPNANTPTVGQNQGMSTQNHEAALHSFSMQPVAAHRPQQQQQQPYNFTTPYNQSQGTQPILQSNVAAPSGGAPVAAASVPNPLSNNNNSNNYGWPTQNGTNGKSNSGRQNFY